MKQMFGLSRLVSPALRTRGYHPTYLQLVMSCHRLYALDTADTRKMRYSQIAAPRQVSPTKRSCLLLEHGSQKFVIACTCQTRSTIQDTSRATYLQTVRRRSTQEGDSAGVRMTFTRVCLHVHMHVHMYVCVGSDRYRRGRLALDKRPTLWPASRIKPQLHNRSHLRRLHLSSCQAGDLQHAACSLMLSPTTRRDK